MRININRDIEEAYKDQFMKGFTMRECGYIALALILALVVGYILYHFLSVPLSVSAYIALPFLAPPLLIGFVKIQGLTLIEYLKEILYERKIKELYYDADEYSGNKKIFSMNHETMEKKRKRR